MKGDSDDYFAHLNSYRRGDVDAIVGFVSRAVLRACEAAERSAARLAALPQRWRATARPPAGSPEETLIANLLGAPIFNAETAQQLTGIGGDATHRALDRLVEAGILTVLPAETAKRVWAARDVFTELDALPLIVGRDSPPVSPRQLDSAMLLSSCRFRL